MKYILFIISLFTFSLGYAQLHVLSTSESNQFKVLIKKKTEQIHSIRTDFTQEKHLSFLTTEITSKGKMYLNKSGDLRWEYTSPNPYVVIFNNNTILINDNGNKSAINANNALFKKINQLIAGSLSGKLLNSDEFTIKFYKNSTDYVVKLLPKNATLQGYIKQIFLFFPKGNAIVSKVKLIEPSKDYTIIKFINKELNVSIDSSKFDF